VSGKIRDIIIGLLVSTIMIFIGYKLNDYFARERVSIEYVEFLPEMNYLPYKADMFSRLIENRQFRYWLSRAPIVRYDLFMGPPNFFTPSQVKTLISVMEEFVQFVREDSGASKKLKATLKNVQSQQQDISTLIEEANSVFPESDLDYLYGREAEDVMNWIDRELKRRIPSNEKAKELAKLIFDDLKRFESTRTGGLDILVIFLNSGNTDGLAKPDGVLELVDRPELIPITLYEGTATRIEKRSMIEVRFRINEGEASPDQLKNLKELVKKKSSISGVIEVKDFHNKTIRSRPFPFPVSD